MRMFLRKEFVVSALLACSIAGCRSKAYESMSSSSAPPVKSSYQGDPYTFGGIQDGTGGLIAATRSSMETETYSEPKFKKLAGPEEFASMSGHGLSPAGASEVRGDYQPLPSEGEHHGTPAPAADSEPGH
jgi:hypothetical protein